MNKPDETTLNRWLRGELEGEDLRKIEAWADDNAGDLDSEFKCDIGWDALGAEFMKAIPAEEEPPYPEFFNHKLRQSIEAEELEQEVPVELVEPGVNLWQKLRWMLLPTAVAAGVAFYAGSHVYEPAVGGEGAVARVSYERVYVPDSGVEAAFSESDGATEIVLQGLSPIADELDIVKGEVTFGEPDTFMVVQPLADDDSDNEVTFF